MDGRKALRTLLRNPDHFIKYYPLNTAGPVGAYLPGTANLRRVRLNRRDAGMRGSAEDRKEGHFGASKPRFLGRGTVQISSFVMGEQVPAGNGASDMFPAIAVPMINYDSDLVGCLNLHGDVSALPHYVLDASANVMITGQLSGCTFCWSPSAAGLHCAHIRPAGIVAPRSPGAKGDALHTRVTTNGRFAASPHTPLSTFGRGDYAGNAIVIGVRKNGSWRLYAQTTNNNGMTMTGAWRIYPGAKTPL